ncbi:hypothetical protein [Schumannella sp. 10F1B-5-1]|uniref:hypothetical protein n=1 Tax=Schumannella sp. 10F1B-5-1 TaxID=2590780 RepID=UPI00113122DA|nr:hypothetical protein [Schumannella sp. 10F1B-5-1]TPW72307.1 hypothetical protein FJ658_08545 [Schumannella sp. 10F1B-5-1]
MSSIGETPVRQTAERGWSSVDGRIVHLLWTVPLALAIDVVLWGACRWFVLVGPVRFPENQYLLPAWIVLLFGSALIGASVGAVPFTPPRTRAALFCGVTVVAFAVFVILLPQPTVGPTFN